jgi:hypothetical protein
LQENENWDGMKEYLLANPDFAAYEAWNQYQKKGEYPWWYEDVFSGEGAALGARGLQRPPSQPTSVADVLRRPYDAPGTGDNRLGASRLGRGAGEMGADWSTNWDEYRAFGDDYNAKRQYMLDHPEFAEYYIGRYGEDSAWWLEGSGGGRRARSSGSYQGSSYAPGDWSANWDEYQALGEDWDAKKQYMLDNPAFAKYYKDRYGNAWWENESTGRGPFVPRSYGGGGGGGSPWLGGGGSGGGGGGYAPRVDPRYMDRSLWESPGQQRQWIPYSNPTPDWLRAGDRLAPDPIRKWIPPRF